MLINLFKFQIYFIVILIISLSGCSYKRKITATNISLHSLYSDNIIFQKGYPILIKGKSSNSGILSVRLANIVKYANADIDGNWKVQFPTTNLNKPFDITIEALDSTIVISNARIGDVYMLIGDGFQPFSLNNHKVSWNWNKKKTDSRIFTYSSNQFYQKGVYSQNWVTQDKEINSYHNLLGRFIADELAIRGNTPVGIINLIVPGLNHQMFESKEYQITKNIKSTPDSILLDKITYRKYDDSRWLKTSLPISMNKHTEKIVWLRKKIHITPEMKSDSFKIEFGAVKGDFELYFNEYKIDDVTNANNEKFYISIGPNHVRPWANILSLRCVVQDSTDGFYGEPVIYNISGNKYERSISKNWRYHTNIEKAKLEKLQIESYQNQLINDITNPLKGVMVMHGLNDLNNIHGYLNTLNKIEKIVSTNSFLSDNNQYIVYSPCIARNYNNANVLVSALRNTQLEFCNRNSFQLVLPGYFSSDINFPDSLYINIAQQLGNYVDSKTNNNQNPTLIYKLSNVDTVRANWILRYKHNGEFHQDISEKKLWGYELILNNNEVLPIEAILKSRSVILPIPSDKIVKEIRYNWKNCPDSRIYTLKNELLMPHVIHFHNNN